MEAGHDRARNPHRSGIAWSKSAIRVILTNPRYTGRQVWNKQRTDEVLLDVDLDDVALGHTGVMRWNPEDKWVISKEITHPPIIDEATLEQAQTLFARHRSGLDIPQRQHRAPNPYVFRGLIYSAACNRRVQGQRRLLPPPFPQGIAVVEAWDVPALRSTGDERGIYERHRE
ncbi:recombinase family protein [Micromonospora parva]|uniref:recombinase family protein n=1 Tax=Micromonospora parva TaxID=1464048 RepID=UPI0036561E19